jgi:hypothetical protein
VKNVFDEWKVFCGFDTIQSIVDFSKDESFIKNLVDIMSFFVINYQKLVAYILQLGMFSSHVLNSMLFIFANMFSSLSFFCIFLNLRPI